MQQISIKPATKEPIAVFNSLILNISLFGQFKNQKPWIFVNTLEFESEGDRSKCIAKI
jgi:hypothetical protein